ncbi:MAG: hypothetical protein KAJ19_15630 [Gammaproteobacteria bacterium]|nr:hypothetical protein [Gammaproteobacteria bacterium]
MTNLRYRRIWIYFVMILVVFTFCKVAEARPVFPGAVGFGTDTSAGFYRAGKKTPIIYVVTNTNHSTGLPGNSTRNGVSVKTGSFLQCLNHNPGINVPKVILFEVSGTINATSYPYTYYIKHPYTTIAVQTAPSPGITLRNITLDCPTHDVLVQHIRSRVGDAVKGEKPDIRRPLQMSCMTGHSDVYNVVFDHCSGSWAIDTSGLFWEEGGLNIYDCTWSNSIFSEALRNSLHSKGPHSMGIVLNRGANNIAFIKNFLVNTNSRNPKTSSSYGSNVVVNNYIYNPGEFNTQFEVYDGPVLSSIVGNMVEGGPSTYSTAYQNFPSIKAISGTSKIYLDDNKCGKESWEWYTQRSASDWSHVRWRTVTDMTNDVRVLSPPTWPTGLVAMDVDDVKAYVLANAGARPADRDSADQRVVNHAKSNGRQGAIIDSPSDVGGWPILARNTRNIGTMANPIPASPHHDDDGDGYTNLEEWLHTLAAIVEGKEQATLSSPKNVHIETSN